MTDHQSDDGQSEIAIDLLLKICATALTVTVLKKYDFKYRNDQHNGEKDFIRIKASPRQDKAKYDEGRSVKNVDCVDEDGMYLMMTQRIVIPPTMKPVNRCFLLLSARFLMFGVIIRNATSSTIGIVKKIWVP
jgi:hypothetical protein